MVIPVQQLHPVIAVQVQKPLNPMSKFEFRTDIYANTSGTVIRPYNTLDAAFTAAREIATADNGNAVGIFQGRQGVFTLAHLMTDIQGTSSGLNFEPKGANSPIGGPYTDRFERTSFGAGATDAAALQAIVGATRFATFVDGASGEIVSFPGSGDNKPRP
ncbi:MAG: hypothetical protein H7123_01565 [Thermoleophilia bacterium]|nr:hypothetical protein [Thermoleophilia bacterium]